MSATAPAAIGELVEQVAVAVVQIQPVGASRM
jgi:hypothetical protein